MIDNKYFRMGLTVAATVLLSIPFVPSAVEAQQAGSRMRVLVANMQPVDGTRDRFGERTSDDLRSMIDLDTHVAMSSRDTDQAARGYDLRLNNLDCVTARQLAALIDVPLVFCGEYRTQDGLIHYEGAFWTVPGGEEFRFEPGALPENDTRVAATGIMEFFQETTEQVAQISYCVMDFNSQNWQGAYDYCTRAVELSPESREARSALARSSMELERFDEALGHFEFLLERDPNSSSALESAGWVATQVGDTDKAREYYSRFLELNPGNVQVRIQIAFDLASAGDDLGAARLLEAGLAQDPDNVELHERYGATIFRAAVAQQAMQPQQAQDGDQPAMSPEVAELFREAIGSLERVVEARGEDTNPQYVVNSMRAYVQLGEHANAVAFGERVVQHFQTNPQVLSELAVAYNRAGQVDRAVDYMSRALEIRPDLPDARTRLATYLLEAGEVDEAVNWIRQAVEAGERTPDALAGVIFSHGWRAVQDGDRALGLRLFPIAKEINGVTDGFRSQVNFFHGYTLYQQGEQVQQPQTVESAQASLPMFREALQYLGQAEAYAQQSGQNLGQLVAAANQYLEIQEAIIARGNR
jgi:tetratricopeptide (TPR) repeat protein